MTKAFQERKKKEKRLNLKEKEVFMLRNVYAPLSGGKAMEKQIEILANNVANANTAGFKEDFLTFASDEANPWPSYGPNVLPPAPFATDMSALYPLHGNEMQYSVVSGQETNFEQGGLRQTGNPLHVGIQGEGFFKVLTPFGERFTRDGGFSIGNDGTLVQSQGFMVMGEKGPLQGLKGSSLRILGGGEVYVDDEFVGKIQMTNFEDKNLLQKIGQNLYVHDGGEENFKPFQGELTQGSLESSNTNAVKAMTDLIIAHRNYEAMQKTLKAHDDSMQITSNKIGEVRA